MYPSRERKDRRSSNDQTVSFLKHSFAMATRPLGFKNHKGTKLYDYQVDFSWIMHEITNGIPHSVPEYVKQANQLIAKIEEEVKKK